METGKSDATGKVGEEAIGPLKTLFGIRQIPLIDPKELQRLVLDIVPEAMVDFAVINPQYNSWKLEIRHTNWEVEYFWGPQTGFGFSDFALENENLFAPYDFAVWSMEEALQKFKDKISSGQKEENGR